MADEFRVNATDASLVRALNEAIGVLANPSTLMRDIGAQMQEAANLRFESKQDPSGQKWPALAPATREIYASAWFRKQNAKFEKGTPGTLLERTRELRNSLAYNVGDDWVDIGTSRATKGGKWQVGFLHETGTERMPRRGLLTADPDTGTLGDTDQEAILVIIRDAMSSAFD